LRAFPCTFGAHKLKNKVLKFRQFHKDFKISTAVTKPRNLCGFGFKTELACQIFGKLVQPFKKYKQKENARPALKIGN
jgi:hypothetical protein